jgi:hypothetical protein
MIWVPKSQAKVIDGDILLPQWLFGKKVDEITSKIGGLFFLVTHEIVELEDAL